LNIRKHISSLSFFRDLNSEQIDKLISISLIKKFDNKYILHFEKENTDRIYFLVDGLAKAYKIDKYSNEVFLYYIYSDHMISEIASLDNDYLTLYSNTIFLKESIVLSIDYISFKRYFFTDNKICFNLMNEIIYKSTQLKNLMDREFILDSVSKVALSIDDNLEMFNSLKRHDIALMLHIQPATLSRVLNRLKRDKIINIDHGEISILNRVNLKNIYLGDQ